MIQYRRNISSPRVVNIEDLRCAAQKRLPKVIFDYIDGGAEGEVTMRENRRAFEAVSFCPRNAVAISHCDLRTRLLGVEMPLPFLLAPCGFSRMLHPHGEVGAARAAGKAGVGYVLSTMSGHRLEEVAKASSAALWYQLYLAGGRSVAEATLDRAWRAGFTVLVITIDTGAAGMRERDVRNGVGELMGGSKSAMLRYAPQMLTHLGWFSQFVNDGCSLQLPNIITAGNKAMSLAEVPSELMRSVVTWADIRWIRDLWGGPIVIKGVLTEEDARRAVDEGGAAVVVSNHGGRQLDGVAASLRVLPKIVKAVGNHTEVLMDGGIRRGSDIVKAICLGARAVLVGRAYAYGLGAAGEAGVTRAIDILRTDLQRTLTLLGCASVDGINRSYVDCPIE